MQADMSQVQVSEETISADFGTRFVAQIIDIVILFIPGLIISLVLPQALAIIIQLIIGVAYYVYFWQSTGQTPGKMVMGLKVVSAESGNILDPAGGAIRYVGMIVSGIPLALGYLWVIWDPKHDAWHDKIAKTKVIKVAK